MATSTALFVLYVFHIYDCLTHSINSDQVSSNGAIAMIILEPKDGLSTLTPDVIKQVAAVIVEYEVRYGC